jgi:soluble lytic murein transglycosylase
MDGRGLGVKRLLPALAAAIATLAAAPLAAQPSHEYFAGLAARTAAPRQLDAASAEAYRAVFAAIDRQDWATVEALLAQRPDGLLTAVARAELYLAANSPRVEVPQIDAWMPAGQYLPQAPQLARLAATRGATQGYALPTPRGLRATGSVPRRTRPRSVEDGTMPATISTAIQERITNDDPDGAKSLLDGIDYALSPEARAEWRQKVAWSYYIENRDIDALAQGAEVAAGAGAWVAEGDWTMGLAAWRLRDCSQSGTAFERAAYSATNIELRAAAYYWASRAALRCRQPERSTALMRQAAGIADSLYGMLAAEQLGQVLPVRQAELSEADWRRIGGQPNVRIAVALNEIGRDRLASEVLLYQARIGDPDDYEPLSRLARDLGLPSTQLYMATNAPSGGRSDPASSFPAPKWVPVTGWRVDPALAYAHTLQESNFRAEAVSPAQAQGLMQITPITVRQHAPRLGLNAAQVNIFDPRVNLAFGQRNLEMLRDAPATGGALLKIMAAYNAGLTPITRWNSEVNDQGDPLLYMESIPYWETRSYVAIVL